MNKLATINKPNERQTPIEVALQIDAQGNGTSKALYSFLELNSRNYAKWAKVNITDNPYAEEGTDYWVYVLEEENRRGGRPTINYKLTASFAKKLAMGSSSPKGEEARDYFIQVEHNAKNLANNVQPQTQIQLIAMMAQQMAGQEQKVLEQGNKLNRHETRINQVEQKFDAVKETLLPQGENWREMIHINIDKKVEATGDNHYNIWTESYRELSRHGFDIKRRLENRRKRMAEFGFSKTERTKIGKLDIIEADPKAKEIYTGIVREMVLKHVV